MDDVSRIIIRDNPAFSQYPKTRGFAAVLHNGMVENFAYRRCIENYSGKIDYSRYRGLVKDQIEAYRMTLPIPIVCGICDCEIKGQYHVDHVVHFKTMVDGFLTGRKNTYRHGGEWVRYHKENAEMRPTCPRCNMSRGGPRTKIVFGE
jgi:hypothetical protein